MSIANRNVRLLAFPGAFTVEPSFSSLRLVTRADHDLLAFVMLERVQPPANPAQIPAPFEFRVTPQRMSGNMDGIAVDKPHLCAAVTRRAAGSANQRDVDDS